MLDDLFKRLKTLYLKLNLALFMFCILTRKIEIELFASIQYLESRILVAASPHYDIAITHFKTINEKK